MIFFPDGGQHSCVRVRERGGRPDALSDGGGAAARLP